jgi:hypothetical protein
LGVNSKYIFPADGAMRAENTKAKYASMVYNKGAVLSFMLCFCWLLGSFDCAAQESTFYVKSSNQIQLVPDVDTLLANEVYHFQIKGTALKSINRIDFDGGTTIQTDSDIVLHTIDKPSTSRKYVIRLYVIKNEKVVHSFRKNFTIIATSLPDYEIPVGTIGFHVDSAWRYTGSDRTFLRYKVVNYKGNGDDTIYKKDVLDTVRAALRGLSFQSQTGGSGSTTLTIRFTKANGASQDYELINKFVPDTQLEKQLSDLTPGCKVEILKIRFYDLSKPADKAGNYPYANIIPYSFIIK